MKDLNKIDYIIGGSVFIQSVLMILQQMMIDILQMEPESTTIYRVGASAFFMLLAIYFSFKRRKKLFIFTYIIVLSILVIQSALFPMNIEPLVENSSRFLLPIVIPSALCLMCVKSVKIAENSLYHISWICFFLLLIYCISYFVGIFEITKYNMTLSFACLLPMASFYMRKTKLSITISILILAIVLTIGSRGAAFVFMAYVAVDVLFQNRKLVLPLVTLVVLFLTNIESIIYFLEDLGLHSRTLSLFLSGDIGNDSGRGVLYDICYAIIVDNPFGVGLFADRQLFASYCHNIIIELLLNWGWATMMILSPFYIIFMLKFYSMADVVNKNRIICYSFVLIAPMMTSSSYLINSDLGIYIGMLYLINKELKAKKGLLQLKK